MKHRERIRRRKMTLRGWRPAMRVSGYAWIKGHRW